MASSAKVWSIEISRGAEKQIKKLGRDTQVRIVRFLRDRVGAASNPRQWGKPLRGDKTDLWRYRVGDYRLICEIHDRTIAVLVLEVGHRKDVYR